MLHANDDAYKHTVMLSHPPNGSVVCCQIPSEPFDPSLVAIIASPISSAVWLARSSSMTYIKAHSPSFTFEYIVCLTSLSVIKKLALKPTFISGGR